MSLNRDFTLKVKVNSRRPDFRVFASYFFGDDLHNYDSDGNSNPVSSKEWTELYMRCRQNSDLSFDIYPVTENGSVLEVSSTKKENVYRVAYFLAKETKGEISNEKDEIVALDSLKEEMGVFDLEDRLLLAKNSIWRKATEENPYPSIGM